MAGPRIHDTKTALKSKRAIRNAAPGRRAAFAIGMFGGSAVMLARRGKPASVLAELRTMRPPEAAPPGDQKGSIKIATSGLLFRDGDELVLQCRERPDVTKITKARKYFRLLKAGTPWSKVRVMRLRDADEGDPEPDGEGEGEAEAEDDPGHEAADESADEAAEDQIVDAWDDEPLPPAISSSPVEPPAAPDTARQTPDGLAPPSDPAAKEAVEAARVARLVATMAPRLLGAGITEEALQATIADLLGVMSADRLLLALCSATNMDHLATAARDASAEPDATEPPLANDESGHDRIGRAMATLGERIGRERGLVAPGESATAGAFILGMVRQLWSRNAQLAPEEVIAQLSAVLVGVFRTKGGKDLRAMLGMSGATPTEARPDAAGEAAPWRRSLADARGGWAAALPGAITSVARIKDVIRDTYADEDVDINGAFAMLDGVVSRLDDGLLDRLDGLLGETQDDRLASRRQGVEQAVAAMRTYLETDEVASSLDGNDFVEGTSVIAVLVAHLAGMQASLAGANAD